LKPDDADKKEPKKEKKPEAEGLSTDGAPSPSPA